jgi:hypothetical protein
MRKQNAPDENKFSCREAIVAGESKDESEELMADKLISALAAASGAGGYTFELHINARIVDSK